MNNNELVFCRLAKWLLPLVLLSPFELPGQPDSEDEELYTLSLFEVDESETQGYLATSTLGGTRIKTDLKDLGAAISVVTSEFMDDVGATDAATLLSYTTNTEVGGYQGNFTGAEASNVSRFLQTDARTNPQLNQRIRGLGAADLTRGYFLTDIPFDSYNTDRVTVSRGPNSLLFGIGSPGGVINNTTKRAIHNNDFGELKVRFDNYSSWRTEFDYNKSIVEDRVALRVSFLNEGLKYKQEPAFDDQTRFYGALDVVLFETDSSVTRFRFNGEDGEQTGSPVEVIPPSVAYHNWFEPISPSISQFTGGTPDPWVISPSEGGTWKFQALHDDPIGTGADESNVNTNIHPSIFRHVGLIYSQRGAEASVGCCNGLQGYNGLIPWNANQDTLASTGLAGTAVAEGLPDDTPVGNYREFHTVSPYSESYAVGFAVPTLQNTDVFDYRNQVYSNGLDRIEREFDAVNFALEQTFFEGKAGVEIAWDRQRYHTHQDFLFSGGEGTSSAGPYDIYINNSVYLITGDLNPNLGRAYTRVRNPTQRFDTVERETFRVTAFAEADFRENDGFLKYLGRHRFTGLYNDHTRDNFGQVVTDASDSNEFNMDSAQQHQLDGGRRNINIVAYTSEQSLLGVQSMDDIRLNPIDIPRYEPGFTFDFAYVDTTPAGPLNNGVAGDRMVRRGNVFVRRMLRNETISQTNIDAKAFSWQSYLLNDHIVGLYGYREDDTKSFARQSESEAGFPRLLPDRTHNPEFTKLSFTPALVETGDTTTWSVVGRYPEVLLGDLPGGINLQVHYAESENFNPIGLRNNALGEPIGQPTGTTEEYGFLISTEDNKYSVKVNWFETQLADINAGLNFNLANHAFGKINEHRDGELAGIPWSDHLVLVEGDPAAFPIQSYDQYYNAMLGAVPQTLIDIVNPRQVDTTGDGLWDEYEWDTIPNVRSTQNRLAEGFEVEFVANPTPSWRLMANISKQETIQSDTAAVMGGIVEGFVANAQAARLGETPEDGTFQRDLEAYDIQLTTNILAPVRGARALDNTVSNEQRKWRVTGVSSYEFQAGRFKGFGIGGAIRWEDEAATGYVFQVEEGTGVPIPDVNRPFTDDGLFSGDLWLFYGKKLWDGKIDWRIQLNIRNLVGESDDIPVKTNPDGRVAVIRIPNPRTVYLSNSFKF